MKKKVSVLLILVLVLSMFLGCSQSGNETDGDATTDWTPRKPIVGISSLAAGGSNDTMTRTLMQLLPDYLDCETTVINVTGGSGSVAAFQMAAEPADGHVGMTMGLNMPAVWKVFDYAENLSWEDYYSFPLMTTKFALVVSKDSPFQTYEEFVEYAKTTKGLKWGTNGVGTLGHMSGQTFCNVVGLQDTVAVPYGGGREALAKLVANELDFCFPGIGDGIDFYKSGDLRVLGIATVDNAKIEGPNGYYEVPSLIQAFSDLSVLSNAGYYGYLISRDTPDNVVITLANAIEQVSKDSRFIEMCDRLGQSATFAYGDEADKIIAQVESFIAWMAYDLGVTAGDLSPADFDIPRIENFVWPEANPEEIKPWPAR